MHELIARPFLDDHFVLRPGALSGLEHRRMLWYGRASYEVNWGCNYDCEH